MASARRKALCPKTAPVSNAGLAFDRYLATTSNEGRRELYTLVAGARPPDLYVLAFRRWEAMLTGGSDPVARPVSVSRRFTVTGRLIVGLGGESVHEASITLHRLFGMPIIPGSALKGLLRHYLRAYQRSDEMARHADVLVGTSDSASYLVFHDAWYVPGSAPDDRPLAVDVMTTHHPGYYSTCGRDRDPWDFDDPTPIAFLSARGDYLIAVTAPDRPWATWALQALGQALADWGIGAKTGSGYGRLVPHSSSEETRGDAVATASPSSLDDHPLRQTIAGLTSRDAGRVKGVYDQILQVAEPGRQPLLRALHARLEEIGLLRKWADRPWVRDLTAAIERDA